MDKIYPPIRDADFIYLAFTAALIFFVGIRASAQHRKVEQFSIWLSALAFLGYVATAMAIDGCVPLEWIGSYVLRAALVAGIVLGASCFVGSVCMRTWLLIAPIHRYFRDKRSAERRRVEAEARRQQELREQQIRDEESRRRQEEMSRQAEVQHRLREEAARHQAAEQRRRSDARAECDLCYSKHVAKRISKSLVDAFVSKYMGDDQPADAVETRAQQLQRIIQDYALAANPPKKPTSMQELTEWFLLEKGRIEILPVDDEVRDFHMVQLNIRYADLTQQMLEGMTP